MSVYEFPHLIDAGAEWMKGAACRGYRPDTFFPVKMTDGTAATAVATCNRCPVQSECARYAIVNHIEYGIWGGLSPRARREIASSRSDKDRTRELATYDCYARFKNDGRSDPVKATARELGMSTATVYHHVRIIKFKQIFDKLGDV